MTVNRSDEGRPRNRPSKRVVATASRVDPQTSASLLWNRESQPRRGPKPTLSAEGIAWAAIEIADAEGLGAVSMSRVAETLGFTTMSLYRHVPGKDEMVDLMFDTAMGAPPALEEDSGEWRVQIEQWARAMWALVMEHPWTLDVLTRLRLPGPNELAWMECGMRALRGTGLDGPALLDTLFVVVGQVRINAQYAVAGVRNRKGMTAAEWAEGVHALVREHARSFPDVACAVNAGAFERDDDPLSFGLRCVLDGVERLATRSKEAREGAKVNRSARR